jgi:hypothetical protein
MNWTQSMWLTLCGRIKLDKQSQVPLDVFESVYSMDSNRSPEQAERKNEKARKNVQAEAQSK